jgi:hypothetical protein
MTHFLGLEAGADASLTGAVANVRHASIPNGTRGW